MAESSLSCLNDLQIRAIGRWLGFTTRVTLSTDDESQGGPRERLMLTRFLCSRMVIGRVLSLHYPDMSETAPSSLSSAAVDARCETPPSGAESPPLAQRVPLLDRSGPLLAIFLFVGLMVFVAAFLTVHARPPELLREGGLRTHFVLSHWLNEGYFHYFGLSVRSRPGEPIVIYRSSTGGSMVSAFVLQKLYTILFGHYGWRLVAIHNQIVSLVLSALLGLLAYRITRRTGLDSRRALATGGSVVIVVFTFPDNLALYWEMSTQAYALLFAIIFLLIEERCVDGGRTRTHSIFQAAAAFFMAYMEQTFALAFISTIAAMLSVLEQRRGSWRRFVLLALTPCLAALALYGLQLYGAATRFPNVEITGSTFMFRSGLDGESLYYRDHLDIAWRRDWARNNWPVNREALFRWTWVFILGSLSTLAVYVAYVATRTPRIAIEVLTSLSGAWLLCAAVFSQSVVIHPYIYDVVLFAPLVVALFAVAPALGESLTRRTGAILLVVVLCAFWYSLFQMRLYALRYPMPNTRVGAPPPNAAPR